MASNLSVPDIPNNIAQGLENIYISPLETCNLNCRLCYTKKHLSTLSHLKLKNFIARYQKYLEKINLQLKSIVFCGGEVFTLKNFPRLINQLTAKGIFVTIITNGTIDRLSSLRQPDSIQLLVSLDGPKDIHDQNRGNGNFDKSLKFIKKAVYLNFPTEIMYLVTPQSYNFIDTYSQYLQNFGLPPLKSNYITQKTFFYTENHPLSNHKNHLTALTRDQIIHLKKNYHTIPAPNFGCYQLSLQANGLIYGCCESPKPIGKIQEPIKKTIKAFTGSLSVCYKCPISYVNPKASNKICKGCCQNKFLCGYISELNFKNCTEVTRAFHH